MKHDCGGSNTKISRCPRDRRLAFCWYCNVPLCGRCGSTLTARYPGRKPWEDLLEWIVPKKILEFMLKARHFYRCEKCGRQYPFKRDILRYIFWEVRALFLRP